MTLDRLGRMTVLAATLTLIVVPIAVPVVFRLREQEHEERAEAREQELEELAEERYWDGVRDGECERDCQYTHDGGLMSSVTGQINGYGDCVCRRWLGEPDWESSP